jgi:ribosomal protein L2
MIRIPVKRRTAVAALSLGLAVMLLAGAAFASPDRLRHPRKARAAIAVKHRQAVRKRVVRRHVFAPRRLTRAAEVSAVILDPVTQQFAQVTFDRGRATEVSSDSITLQQNQNGATWRTQAFTVPSGAVVTYNGHPVSLSQIPTGAAVRVESSGSVGGTLAVVRVDAFRRGEAPLPPTSG